MLRDWVQTTLSVSEIGDLLTMTGFELEEITEVEGEAVLDVNIMSNRGDGASVLGMAREVLAKDPGARPTELYLRGMNRFPAADTEATAVAAKASVKIETPDCTRFACRVFEGVQNGVSPAWVQERLRKLGHKPISLLVDLTNYVMLEVGQPLHAYDMDKLGTSIVVRQARTGEKLTTLDGKEHDLTPDNMMICDGERPVGVAGVMGGEDTECDPTTTRCLLESAHFVNSSVRKTRKALGLFTEASFRFERHVDPEGVVAALNRFAELLQEAGGPSPVPGVLDVVQSTPPVVLVKLRMSRVAKVLGLAVDIDTAKGYLERLGFLAAKSGSDELEVEVPTWRIDVLREDDLVEEIGRVHGYEKIPEALPIGTTPLGGVHGADLLVDRLAEAMVRCGSVEIVNHTLRDVHPLDRGQKRVVVRNPHSPEIAYLRDSLLPGLADTSARNNHTDLRLFEIGRVFDGETESVSLGVLMVGQASRPHWQHADERQADFFEAKGVVEAVFRSIGASVDVTTADDPRLHPTRSATALVDGRPVGVLGQIHPDKAEASGLPEGTVLAEFDLSFLQELKPDDLRLRAFSKNPAVRRSITVHFPKGVPCRKMDHAISAAGGECLEKHWLSDIYEGQGVEPGHHSMTFALQLRKMGANLTDEEANQVRDSVAKALVALGGTWH